MGRTMGVSFKSFMKILFWGYPNRNYTRRNYTRKTAPPKKKVEFQKCEAQRPAGRSKMGILFWGYPNRKLATRKTAPLNKRAEFQKCKTHSGHCPAESTMQRFVTSKASANPAPPPLTPSPAVPELEF